MRSETLRVEPKDNPSSIEVLGQHACIDLIENLPLFKTAPVFKIKQEMIKANKILGDMGVIHDPFELEKTDRLKQQLAKIDVILADQPDNATLDNNTIARIAVEKNKIIRS